MAISPSPPAPPPPTHLLDLSTLTTEYTIRIDRALYRLLNADQLTLAGAHFVVQTKRRIDELWLKVGVLDEAEANELERLLEQMLPHILVAPPEVLAQLTPLQRFEIVVAFRELPWASGLPPAGATRTKATSQTGAPSSRASSGSTPGRRRARGSTTRRSVSRARRR